MLIVMKAYIIVWLILGVLLATLSHVLSPFLGKCDEADNSFAHEYAGEMLARLEEMSTESCPVDDYQAAEEDFRSRKHAAVHMKGEMATDFVYAFALAEAWCHYAGSVAAGAQDAARAGVAFTKAKAEFAAIRMKDYKMTGR